MYVTSPKNFVISYENDCHPERSRRLYYVKGASPSLSLICVNLSSLFRFLPFSKSQNDMFRLKSTCCFCHFFLNDAIQFRYD